MLMCDRIHIEVNDNLASKGWKLLSKREVVVNVLLELNLSNCLIIKIIRESLVLL